MARITTFIAFAAMRETASMSLRRHTMRGPTSMSATQLSRRQTLSLAAIALAPTPALASTKTDAEKVLEALQPLSGFVDDGKWDAVRTVLAQSPVVELWKTGNSKNWIRAAALSAGDPELIELSEDLSSALQLTDQYVYDNNFIYFQPGNGKARRSVDGVRLHAIDARLLRSHAGQDEGAEGPDRGRQDQAQGDHREPLIV